MMKSSLLIVTLQPGFGAFIRDGLDPSQFDTFITSDFSEAVHYVRQNDCPTVLLDAQLENQELSVMDIGFALRQLKPVIRFVLVVRPGQDVDGENLTLVATLTAPVSLPELSRLLKNPAQTGKSRITLDTPMPEFKRPERQLDEPSNLVWLTDVSKAAQQLTQLTLESSAQAAFITRQNELWAYAGQLSREAAQELTISIQRQNDFDWDSDLLRFVRLKATAAQHMLYVRRLSNQMMLALVFDAETPFSTIRSQAGKLVKNLFDNSVASAPPAPPAPPVINTPSADLDQEDLEMADFKDLPPFSELLGDVPPPIPDRIAPASALPWEHNVPQSRPISEPVRPLKALPKQIKPLSAPVNPSIKETSPSTRLGPKAHLTPPNAETLANTPARPAELIRSELSDDLQLTRKQESLFDPQSVIDTRVQTVGETTPDVGHRILIESPSMSQVNLSYACVLVPRFEQHYLIGDMAARLNEWLPQLCVAFGWRLEYISVRPEYLQWIARVHLNTAAGYVIKVIRQHTSDRMFNEFPRFKVDNPSGEFWAHGFVVHGGSQPHPQQVIRNFIAQTRMRQGLR